MISSAGSRSDDSLHHGKWAARPVIWGTHGMVGSGTPAGAMAGINILMKGGNAIDAGVATGLAASVLEPTAHNTLGGEVPIIIYLAKEDKVISIAGQGWAPKAATIELYMKKWQEIPVGIPMITVPGAVHAWLTALERYGTLSLGDVAERALELAEKGFPSYKYFCDGIRENQERLDNIKKWPDTARQYLPGGRPPEVGELFLQKNLSRCIRKMILAEEESLRKGSTREEAIRAARDVFYKGEIARDIVRFLQENGGLFTDEDFSEFSAQVEEPIRCTYKNYEIYGNGTWTQSLVFMEALRILEGYDIKGLGHNSADLIHLMAEALKLAFYDREKWVGDPDFVKVPVNELLSDEYAGARRSLIKMDKAEAVYPPGDPRNLKAEIIELASNYRATSDPSKGDDGGTTHLAVADPFGNMMAATPSTFGGLTKGMVAGETGILLNTRGCYFYLDPENPNALAPRKRPRTTPHAFFIKKDGKPFMTLATPGADNQPQSNLQVFFNIVEFGMNVQDAVSAPRFQTSSFPSSPWPHASVPGNLTLEGRISENVGKTLAARGHKVTVTTDWGVKNGFVPIMVNPETGVYAGGADPRRECYMIGW